MTDLLRFLTCGSVDDGKSTLIGRLLHDTHSIYEDQFASLRPASTGTLGGSIDFSLVTDGLRAEREQGITIDVAYRSFSTPRRKFIIADTPGHEQYTRNMATGASTASLAIVLIDARKGVLPQTRRHTVIAWLLGIRNFALAINKMDLVDFDEQVFRRIASDFDAFSAELVSSLRNSWNKKRGQTTLSTAASARGKRNIPAGTEQSVPFFYSKNFGDWTLGSVKTVAFPVCSIDGDNIVTRSGRMPWFDGPPLLEYLEPLPVETSRDSEPLRFPVQYVLRSTTEARRYAGAVASGTLRKGDRIVVLPSGLTTGVASIRIGDREIESAAAPLSVSVALEDELDIGRGDLFAAEAHRPIVSRRCRATLLWMDEKPLEVGRPYLIKHTTRQVCASVLSVKSVLDPATLRHQPADQLAFNQFGEIEMETHQPLYCDPYSVDRTTGAFILIDPIGNGTLGAGMISTADSEGPKEPAAGIGLTVWFTGLSSAGKSTIGQAVYEKLWATGHKVELLDGDVVRQSLNRGLGFSKDDRDENVRRIGFVADLLTRNGVIVLVSAISPYRSIRGEMREKIGSFLEVFVNAPLGVCEQRDLKGIYRRARAGELHGVTGVDDPYEPPLHPDIECRTDLETPAESAARVLAAIVARMSKRRQDKSGQDKS